MVENAALEEFKGICRKNFQYLVAEYGFSELSLPSEEFINEFQVRYGRDGLTLIIVGEGYGTSAHIYFIFKDMRRFGYQQLLPEFKPFKKLKIMGSKKEPSQYEQVRIAAEQIKSNLTDILLGKRTEVSTKLNEGKDLPPSNLA